MSNEKREKKDPYTLFGYQIKNNTAVQVGVGLASGVYFTATEKPFYNAPEDGKYFEENRQYMADELDNASKDPVIKASPEATYKVELLKSQNNTQEAWEQPVPKESVDVFIEGAYEHAKLDAKSLAETGELASREDHRYMSLEQHKKEAVSFRDAEVTSGDLVHTTIGPVKEILSLAQIGFEERTKEIINDDNKVDNQDYESRFGLR